MLKTGTLAYLHQFDVFPDYCKSNKLLSLAKDKMSDDPVLLALRFAAYGFEKTLSEPVVRNAFEHAERKSRYVESDALLREYPKTLDAYEEYLSQPANFTDWWDGESIYNRINDLLC